jgi:hypothetical protein
MLLSAFRFEVVHDYGIHVCVMCVCVCVRNIGVEFEDRPACGRRLLAAAALCPAAAALDPVAERPAAPLSLALAPSCHL